MLKYIALAIIIIIVVLVLFWVGHISNEKADIDYTERQKYDDEEQAKYLAEWSKKHNEKKNNK